MSFLLLVFLYNSIIAETRPLWDFFLPLRTVGLHFGESRNTSYALRAAAADFFFALSHCVRGQGSVYLFDRFHDNP